MVDTRKTEIEMEKESYCLQFISNITVKRYAYVAFATWAVLSEICPGN